MRSKKQASSEVDEEDLADESPSPASPAAALKTRKYEPSWTGIAQSLTEGDLENPAARKMLVNELSRLSQETETLSEFREKFYEADKESGVLAERVSQTSRFNALSAIMVSIGAIMSGLGTNQLFASMQEPPSATLPGGFGLGVVLLLMGLASVFAPVAALWVKR